MGIKAVLTGRRDLHSRFFKSLGVVIFCFWGLTCVTGCGGNSTIVELPKDFIRDFIVRHETMLDRSLVYYYVKEEQQKMAEQVDIACRINESRGGAGVIENAAYDFSELQIDLVGKKEKRVNDEPVVFIKVAVKGNYKMKLPDGTKRINVNDTIILQWARNEWKVTESNNPWS